MHLLPALLPDKCAATLQTSTSAVTVAIEVPVYPTPEAITHMQRELGFTIPLSLEITLTGQGDCIMLLLDLRGSGA